MIPDQAALVLLVIAFAACDRLFGAKHPAFKGKKAAILALAMGAGFICAGVAGAAIGFGWFVYRALELFAGSGAPQNGVERLWSLVRHLLALAPALAVAGVLGLAWAPVTAPFIGYALGATSLAIAYGYAVLAAKRVGIAIGRENALVELSRGAVFGAATWLAFVHPINLNLQELL